MGVLILLPPSEGKTAPPAGPPVDLAELWQPQLGRARRRVLSKLVAMCARGSARSVAASLATLGLSAGQAAEVGRNAGLPEAPAAPASEVYTGVLYEALDAATLPAGARAWLDERAVVFSGLWGAVRLGDRIPAYRCSVSVTLPQVGGLTAYWKKVLDPVLPAGQTVLDLRSGAYAAMWQPGPGAVVVRVLHEANGKRSVVSHFNKATKGRMVRALAGSDPAGPDELITALRDLKYTVEERPVVAGRPRHVDVVVAEL